MVRPPQSRPRREENHAAEGVLAASPAMQDAWHVVARSIDVTRTRPMSVVLLGRPLAVWRTPDGAVLAVPDRCPHREAPLSAGTVESGCLVCPYHGWTFANGGRCVRIPSADPALPPPPRAHLTPVAVQEHYGLVWVCIGTPTKPIPIMSFENEPSFRRINTPVEIWKTSATRMTDNFLDIAHFPWVHVGTFGRTQETLVPRIELGALDDGFFGYRYEILANNNDDGSLVSGQREAVVERAMSTGFQLPFVVRSTIRYSNGLEHIILMLSTPIDDVTSYFTFVIWRNDDFSVSAEDVIRFDLAIGAEDKRMLEQVPGLLPIDQTTLVSVQADKCSVEWRRQLAAGLAQPNKERSNAPMAPEVTIRSDAEHAVAVIPAH